MTFVSLLKSGICSRPARGFPVASNKWFCSLKRGGWKWQVLAEVLVALPRLCAPCPQGTASLWLFMPFPTLRTRRGHGMESA